MPILNDIIDWVEDKPNFWQIAIDRLIRNNELTDTDISELTKICKTDFELSDHEFEEVDFESLRDFADITVNRENIVISKIKDVQNVNALSSTAELNFAPSGLTVVYGDNGSGKSSYVSILKHVCHTRGHKPKINNNLYKPHSFEEDKKANIEYTTDGSNFSTVSLINDVINNNTLKKIDVFDTFSANHYIEDQDEIAFIPEGLTIIENLAAAVKKVESEITADLANPSLKKFDYELLEISVDSTAHSFLDKLNSDTTLEELKALSVWNSKKDERIEFLQKENDKLKAIDPKKSLKANEEKIKRFNILQTKIENLENKLSGDALINLKQVLNNFATSRKALKDSSETAFSDLPLDGVGNSSWKLLWESARKFYNESKKTANFPETQEDSSCPLCLQNLGEEAKKRFLAFEDFIKNDIQKSFNEASENFDLTIESLERLEFDFKEQEPITREVEELIPDYSQKQKEYLEVLASQKEYLVNLLNSKKWVEEIESIDITNTPKTLIQKLIKSLEEENEKLKTQSIEDDLKPIIKELNQLNGEKKLYEFRPKIGREIFRQKKIKLLKQCIAKCNTRSITIFSNELASNYITQNLKQNFKDELSKLGFRSIKIETETKGQRGKQYHFLRLNEENVNNIALKDILSEGEHRCISLATFLSELSISEHKSSIIFDDPVSSLDHKWRNKISKRIVEESLERQVIVFTHDITFLLMIEEHCNNLDSSLKIESLTRKKTETGIIATNPPWDTLPVKKRLGILKNELVKLKSIEKNETEEVYKEKAKPFYNKLRETWERFVEWIFHSKLYHHSDGNFTSDSEGNFTKNSGANFTTFGDQRLLLILSREFFCRANRTD